jgi:DNA-binding transcriptional regulator YiaG
MRMRVYVVAESENRAQHIQDGAIAYAKSRGWDWKIPSEAWSAIGSRPGQHLPETLSTLSPGDVLLISDVCSLSEKPSEIDSIIRGAIGRGIRIHSLDPLGDLNQYLPGLFAGLAASAPVESELQQALSDMAAMEARHKQDLEDFQTSLYEQILREGATLTVGKVNGNGHADSEVASEIKHARAKRNMSLRQLGELAGVSHSQVQRLEQTGRGDGLEAVLSALQLNGEVANEVKD